MSRVLLVAAGFVAVAVLAATAQTGVPVVSPDASGLAPAPLQDATALLERYVRNRKIAGAVAAVARRGRVGYLQAIGVQDLETRTPMSAGSLFRIYSMTKAVTAVAAMMLHEQGRFQLTDPVAKYLPEFGEVMVGAPDAAPRAPVRPITVEDLLLHTSGLSHRTSDLYRQLGVRSRADTLPVFVRKITQAPLMEDPHTRFRYSEATTVVGRLVEVWSGQPLDAFLQSRVFEPLRMPDTSFWVPAAKRARLATVYAPAGDGGLTPLEIEAVPFTERPALLEGAVGLVSTVPDFVRFGQMLLNGGILDGVRVLQAETAARIVRNGLPGEVLQLRGGAMGWGLANVNVRLRPGDGGEHAGEFGWDGTAGTIFWADPASETVIVLMTQSAPADPGGLRQAFKTLVLRAIN